MIVGSVRAKSRKNKEAAVTARRKRKYLVGMEKKCNLTLAVSPPCDLHIILRVKTVNTVEHCYKGYLWEKAKVVFIGRLSLDQGGLQPRFDSKPCGWFRVQGSIILHGFTS